MLARVRPTDIAACFGPYRPAGWTVARAVANLDVKLLDQDFESDVEKLVAEWPAGYTVQAAGQVARAILNSDAHHYRRHRPMAERSIAWLTRKFAVRAIGGAPLFGDLWDRVELLCQQGVHRRAAATAVLEAAAALGASRPDASPTEASPPTTSGSPPEPPPPTSRASPTSASPTQAAHSPCEPPRQRRAPRPAPPTAPHKPQPRRPTPPTQPGTGCHASCSALS